MEDRFGLVAIVIFNVPVDMFLLCEMGWGCGADLGLRLMFILMCSCCVIGGGVWG